jgi:putative SOS response-associated peptidase YedK
MCGRITQQLSSDEIAQLFGAESEVEDPGGHFNVAPTQSIRAVVERSTGRVVTALRWGLIPSWADDPKIGARMINARSETVAEKPAFRSAFRHQRCIVPADAYYEWQQTTAGKIPHAIVRQDGRPLAFAGLWAAWRDPRADQPIRSCAIITTAANSSMSRIHDRMPAILSDDAWTLWLDPREEHVPVLQSLLAPAPDDLLRAYPVSRLVNDVHHDGPELLVPVG